MGTRGYRWTYRPARPLWFRTLRFSSLVRRYAFTMEPSELLSAYSVRRFGKGVALRVCRRLPLKRRMRRRGIATSGSNSPNRLLSERRQYQHRESWKRSFKRNCHPGQRRSTSEETPAVLLNTAGDGQTVTVCEFTHQD